MLRNWGSVCSSIEMSHAFVYVTHMLAVVWWVTSCVAPWAHPHLWVGVKINVTFDLTPSFVEIFGNIVSNFLRKWTRASVDVTAWALRGSHSYLKQEGGWLTIVTTKITSIFILFYCFHDNYYYSYYSFISY